MSNFVFVFLAALLGATGGYFLRKQLLQKKLGNLETLLGDKLSKAQEEAKKILAEAKDKAGAIINSSEKELKREKEQLNKTQERLLSKEILLEEKSRKLEEKEEKLLQQAEKVKEIKVELEAAQQKEIEKLEQLAHLDKNAAKQELLVRLEQVYSQALFE